MHAVRRSLIALALAGAMPATASADRLVDPGGPLFKSVESQTINTFGDDLKAFGGFVYFAANDNVNGNELWRTDGTTTSLVKNINPGVNGTSSNPNNFWIVGNRLFFNANPGDSTPTVFYIDSTDLGTVKTAKATPTNGGGAVTATGPLVGTVNGKAIIRRYTEAMGYSGYALGDTGDTFTKISGAESFGTNNVFSLAATAGGWMYYQGTQTVSGYGDSELWRTDGSSSQLVTDINPGSANGKSSSPNDFVATSDRVYFTANNGTSGRELWTSNGPGDTHMVHEHQPNLTSTSIEFPGPVANGNILYYTPNDPVTGNEVWRTDGSEAGTRVVKDLSPGTGGYSGPDPFPFKTGVGMLRGTEVIYADGTPDNATVLNEVAGDGYGPNTPVVKGDRAYFVGGASPIGQLIWRTDGTADGTFPLTAGGVQSLASGNTSAQSLAVLGDRIVFFARNAATSSSGEVQPYAIDTTQPDELRVNTGAPVITTAVGGTRLDVSEGTWSGRPTKYSYQWFRNGAAIPGEVAQRSYYFPPDADKGQKFKARVTTIGIGAPRFASADSAEVTFGVAPTPTASPSPNPSPSASPSATPTLTVKKKAKLTGKAKVGKKLKLSLPKFGQSGVKLSFRWFANKKQIKKQKKSSLKLTKKQKGKKITVKITVKKAGFKTLTLTVGPTKKVKGG